MPLYKTNIKKPMRKSTKSSLERRMMLLAMYLEFVKKVKEIRLRLHLPEHGLIEDSDDDQKWQASFDEKVRWSLLDNNKRKNNRFQNRLETEVRKKQVNNAMIHDIYRGIHSPRKSSGAEIQLDRETYERIEKESDLESEPFAVFKSDTKSFNPFNFLNEVINDLIHDFNLPISFRPILFTWIKYGVCEKSHKDYYITMADLQTEELIESTPIDLFRDASKTYKGAKRHWIDTDTKYLSVKIFGPLSEDDFDGLRTDILKQQKSIFPFIKKMRKDDNIELDLEIWNERTGTRNKKGRAKIIDGEKELTDADIANKILGHSKHAPRVKAAIHRVKKRFKVYFG